MQGDRVTGNDNVAASGAGVSDPSAHRQAFDGESACYGTKAICGMRGGGGVVVTTGESGSRRGLTIGGGVVPENVGRCMRVTGLPLRTHLPVAPPNLLLFPVRGFAALGKGPESRDRRSSERKLSRRT